MEGKAAPQSDASTGEGFSMSKFFEGRHSGKVEDQPTVDEAAPADHASPVEGDSSSSEGTTLEEQAAGPPTTEKVSDADASAEQKTDTPISKHEREKFKLRERTRQEKEAREKAEAELARLRKEYGLDSEKPESSEPDPIAMARLQERVGLSKERFIQVHGEEVFTAKITGDDSPWAEIEERAQRGDPEAKRLTERALSARDPYQEVYNILGEQDLYEKYGTRNLSQLITKALEAEREAIEAQVMAKYEQPRHEPGAAPRTLGDVGGKGPSREPSQGEKDFSLRGYFTQREGVSHGV